MRVLSQEEFQHLAEPSVTDSLNLGMNNLPAPQMT